MLRSPLTFFHSAVSQPLPSESCLISAPSALSTIPASKTVAETFLVVVPRTAMMESGIAVLNVSVVVVPAVCISAVLFSSALRVAVHLFEAPEPEDCVNEIEASSLVEKTVWALVPNSSHCSCVSVCW